MSTAMIGLIIFAVSIVIFIWDKLPMATSALLGCAAMVVFGVCDFSTAFGQFASSTVVILISIQVVGAAMAETGLAASFGRLLTRVSKNNERVILLTAYLMAAALSAFLTNVTVLAIFMPIIVGMRTKDKKINELNLVIPVLTATAMGGISTLVGSSQQLTAVGLIEELGFGVKVFDLTPVGLILTLLGLLFSLFIGYPLGKKIWGARENDGCTIKAAEDIAPDRKKITIMCVIIALMLIGYITVVIPVAITAVLTALLCIVCGCIKQKEAVKQVNWDVVGRLGACLGMAKALSASGGITLLSDWVTSIFGMNLSPFALFALAVLLTQVLSLVISNSTAILIVLPIVIAISGDMNLNLVPYAIGVAYGSSMGLCSPLSGSTNTMSMAAGYKFRDYLKYGVLLDVLCYVVIVVFTPVFFPLTL